MSTEATANPTPTATPAPNATVTAGYPPAPNQAAPQPSPDFQRPPVGAPGGPPIPPTVPLTVDEYQRLRGLESQFAEFQRQQQAAIEAEQAKANELLAAKGQVEEAFTAERANWQTKLQKQQEEYQRLRESYHGEKVDAVLADALSGVVFAGPDDASRAEAARLLRKILRDELDAVPSPDGAVSVVDKASRRPAADVIRERLSDPKLAFFLASRNGGGSGTDGTRPPANAPYQPGSLDAIAASYRAAQGQYPAFGLGPRSN